MNEQEALERFKKSEEDTRLWNEYRKVEMEEISKSFLYTLEITHKCFLKCRHCFAESSPEEDNFLEADLVEKLVEDSVGIFSKHSESSKPSIRITGGDPFLHPDLESIIISFSSRKDRLGKPRIDIETSGGWAVSDDVVRNKVRVLKKAGADCISMTNDHYHKEQNVFPNTEYGRRVQKICEEESLKFRYIKVDIPVPETINIDNGSFDFIPQVVPIGRARNLPEKYWSGSLHDYKCKINPFDYDFNLMFNPLGNVYLCISGKCFKDASLAIGNLHDKSIIEILNEDSNLIVRKLRNNGIRGLTELAGLSLVEHYKLFDKMGSCGLCHEMLRTYGAQINNILNFKPQ